MQQGPGLPAFTAVAAEAVSVSLLYLCCLWRKVEEEEW